MKEWTFIMKNILIPHLFIMFHSFKKKSQKVYVFLFISGYILPLYFCHPCGTVNLHTDTIRKHGVYQLLKFLAVIKAKKPRLKQSRSCSCHLVADIKISCHWLCHWFIFRSQEKFQIPYHGIKTPKSVWVLP